MIKNVKRSRNTRKSEIWPSRWKWIYIYTRNDPLKADLNLRIIVIREQSSHDQAASWIKVYTEKYCLRNTSLAEHLMDMRNPQESLAKRYDSSVLSLTSTLNISKTKCERYRWHLCTYYSNTQVKINKSLNKTVEFISFR